MELVISENNELINKAYSSSNYKIEYSPTCNNNRCIIFFSGNGLYYPDTEEEFITTIFEKDRYEWASVGRSNEVMASYRMIIYVRDVFKSWYEKGISRDVNSIDKLIELLRTLTKGYEVITCGNSAGGYIATIIGHELKAERVFNFGGQWKVVTRFCDRYSEVVNISKYYNIVTFANSNVLYFYSAHCRIDIEQFYYVKDTNVTTLPIKSESHGALLLNECYKYVLIANNDNLNSLINRFKNKVISPRIWAFYILKGNERRIAIMNSIIESHKSLQILRKMIN